MTITKVQITDITIASFFRGCVWDFKEYPKKEIAKYFSRKRNTIFDLSSVKDTQLYYDIRDFLICVIYNEEPYTYKSKAFPSFPFLLEFMQLHGYDSFACIDDVEQAEKEWIDFWSINKGIKYVYDYRNVISNIIFYLQEFRDKRIGLDRDLWRQKDLNINKERINLSKENTDLNFYSIKNAPNREIIKMWFKYLIGGTEMAYSTILNYLTNCRQFVNFLGDKSILDATNDDIQNYKRTHDLSANANNRLMRYLQEMYTYLATKDIYNKSLPITKLDFARENYKHVYKAVPEITIMEIFKHLHELDEVYLLIFLVNLFTGIRISDICLLKKDCLMKNELGYFIFHSVQKMQDTGGIPISQELYDLLQEHIKSLPKDCEYAFPSQKDNKRPFLAITYARHMKRKIKEWNIKLPDGTDYEFGTHAYRHTIATQLYKMGMPSTLIQLGILHHQEINMSRFYIDNGTEMQLETMNEKGINVKAEDVPLNTNGNTALANGYCNMPLAIQCPNANACLHCEYFRTSHAFLDVHEKHLKELEEKLEYYNANGYVTNAVFAEKEKKQLEKIIEKLKGDESDATDISPTIN